MNRISEKIDIHELRTNLLRALWVVDKLTTKEEDRFTVAIIADFLIEEIGIDVLRQAIDRALKSKKGKGLTNHSKVGFKIMKAGIEMLELETRDKKVNFFQSGTEYKTKRVVLGEIFDDKVANVRLCDSYVDVRTLDVIHDVFPKEAKIKILTFRIVESREGKFERSLAALVNDGFNIEVRLFDNCEIHDRYIITEIDLFLSGNSLNYIGRKESFIIKLGDDTRQTILEVFNRRWKIAQKVEE